MMATKTEESWRLVRETLDNVTSMLLTDARDERERIEGLRFLARVATLCVEMTLDTDPDAPWLLDMCTQGRMVGGPNPDGKYYLGMIGGGRSYLLTGLRGTSVYLGIQILAGTGMSPRRMDGYVSDTDLQLGEHGEFALYLSATQPSPDVLGEATWVYLPPDASSLVVREYIADAATETPAQLSISVVAGQRPADPVTDEEIAEQFSSMAWAILKLATLHRSIRPDLLDQPNTLVTMTAEAAGAADTNPDNLYMLGSYLLEPDEHLVLDFQAPETRYWNVTLETVFHELTEPHRRRISVSNKGIESDSNGRVQISVGAFDAGDGFWLDTGGRRRGFIVFRWLDNPRAPDVVASVRKGRKP